MIMKLTIIKQLLTLINHRYLTHENQIKRLI